MADANYVKFNKRLNIIDRRHRKMSRGYMRLVERDGMLIPVANSRPRLGFPVKGLLLTLAAFMAFKGFLLTYLGPITYEGRVDKLADGGIGEQIAAWVMSPDVVTTWIATQFVQYF